MDGQYFPALLWSLDVCLSFKVFLCVCRNRYIIRMDGRREGDAQKAMTGASLRYHSYHMQHSINNSLYYR